MKMASLVVSLLGVLALVLGVVEWLCPSVQILHLTPSGYLRGATALYLLAIVIMLFGRTYCCCAKQEAGSAPKA